MRYEVRIEVKAAHDPQAVAAEAVDDCLAEIRRLLRQLEGLTDDEIMKRVYQTFAFDLCAACQRQYIENPLGAALP